MRKNKNIKSRSVGNPESRSPLSASAGIGLLAILLIGAVVFGIAVTRVPKSENQSPMHAAVQPLPSPQYSPDKPSKEYIYAGSKLVAVSEPANFFTDLAIWRPSTGTWWVVDANGNSTGQAWGVSTDLPAPADFDGDGKTDFCVFRPGSGTWYVLLTGSGGASATYYFGLSGDKPVPADYNGDGKAELAVFRPSTSTWYLQDLTLGYLGSWAWGTTGDVAVPSDYDGDGKTDIAIWRDSSATFYAINSSDGSANVLTWGSTGDKPVPGDYDGDLKTDFAVWRADNTWYIRKSSTGTAINPAVSYGFQSSDRSVQGDYDSDGKTDVAVWRPSNGTWYIIRSTAGMMQQTFGQSGDEPVAAPYRRY